MLPNYKPFLIFLIALFTLQGNTQVTGVKYQMKYDTSTCFYDCYLIIDSGSATSFSERIQFNSQFSIITPYGTSITVDTTYMPLLDNFDFMGTDPQEWNIPVSKDYPINNPLITFHSIYPKIFPQASYNSVSVGDTIRLFSLSVSPISNSSQGIRIYENDIDPDPSDPNMSGLDFTNGFTMGGVIQLYLENAPQVYPPDPQNAQTVIDTSIGDLIIDINPKAGSLCQEPLSFEWLGPNGFTSTNEDVMISSYSCDNLGTYTLILTDAFGLKDTSEIQVLAAPDSPCSSIADKTFSSGLNGIDYHMRITGDANRNSQFTTEYRRTGESTYQMGAPVMRAFSDTEVDGNLLGEDFFAGSIMNLSANTSYDIRLTISDSDAINPLVFEQVIQTQDWHLPISFPDTVYVMPGNGGGDGSNGNPYQGIQAAVDNANPGDIIMVNDGTYNPFSITNGGNANAPIQIRSMNLHGAILDGNNTSTGIITIGSFSDSIAHVIIDGFEIRNGKWGIDAQNTQYLIVRNNNIEDVDYGFVNRRENGWEHHQYVFNNKITGRTTWPQTNGNIPNERGVDIRGNYNDVSYNTISDFGDGISTDGPMYMTSYALDIHHNDITRIVDDMIEIDGIVSNARVYNNRCYNGRTGISLAPIFGGPAYVYRNELVNMEHSALKMNRSPSGLIIAHNSIINSGDGMSSPSGWKNVYFYNNLIFAGNYCFQEYQLAATDTLSWDYNGYYSNRGGNAALPWFKWDDVNYDILTDLNSQTNIEEHGVQVALSDVENVTIPAIFSTEVAPATIDMTPKVNSPIHNNGKVIENLNDGYVTDNMPDIGAIELGGPIPVYGHDFGTTCDRNDLSLMTWNGSKNDNWYEQYNWTPCGIPFELSEVIVPGLISQYPIINTDVHVDKMSLLQNAMTTVKGEGVDVNIGQ